MTFGNGSLRLGIFHEVRHTKASKAVSDLKDSEARFADLAQSEDSSLNKIKLFLKPKTQRRILKKVCHLFSTGKI